MTLTQILPIIVYLLLIILLVIGIILGIKLIITIDNVNYLVQICKDKVERQLEMEVKVKQIKIS